MEEILISIAHGALAILVATLAIYLSLRLLGRIAKFAIGVVAVALILWFLLSDNSVLQTVKNLVALPFSPWEIL